MNIYNERPINMVTVRQFGRWFTTFMMDIRELTAAEREQNQVPDTYTDDEGVVHTQEAWTATPVFYRHVNPLSEADYEPIVSALVRARYPDDKVMAIIQNFIIAPTNSDAITEWESLQLWREEAKQLAHDVTG